MTGGNPFSIRDYSWGQPPLTGECDPHRFLDEQMTAALSANVTLGKAVTDIPFAGLSKPVTQSNIALVSTAGLSMKGDQPFDMETEKKRPTWGDPTWRRLTADVDESVEASHLHTDTKYLKADINVCFPVPLLHQLCEDLSNSLSFRVQRNSRMSRLVFQVGRCTA